MLSFDDVWYLAVWYYIVPKKVDHQYLNVGLFIILLIHAYI